jgi:hypothetical protein
MRAGTTRESKCSICGRELNGSKWNEHHLLPKSKKGKDVVPLHTVCHNHLHATFTENELRDLYREFGDYIPFLLRTHEGLIKFAKWITKKPLDFHVRTKDRKERRKKRRR